MYFGLVRNYFGILKCRLVWNSKNCISLDYLATEFRQKYLEAEFVTTGEDWGLNEAEFVTTGEDWGLNEAEFITSRVDWGINGAEVVTTGEDGAEFVTTEDWGFGLFGFFDISFLAFILRFWNQIFTCLSDNPNSSAKDARLGLHK